MNGNPSNGSFATVWPLQWKNSWFVRTGAEYAASPALTLRGGVLTGTNPVSSQGLFTIFRRSWRLVPRSGRAVGWAGRQ